MKKRITTLIPEALGQIDQQMNRLKLEESMQEKIPICGIAVGWDGKRLKVFLGNNLFGFIPFDQISIYPISKIDSTTMALPREIYFLLEKQIFAIVESVGDEIILSRKNNMAMAKEYLFSQTHAQAYIYNINVTLGFADLGYGILGFINIREVCKSRLRTIEDLLKLNTSYPMKIIGYDENRQSFLLSYKEAFGSYEDCSKDFIVSETYLVTVFERINTDGYYVYIAPDISGIMDSELEIPYGTKVWAQLKKIGDIGFKLRFCKFY